MRQIISVVLLLSSFSVNAQKYLAKDGVISFFSETPIEDISAVNTKVSAVFDEESNQLVFQLNITDFIFPKALMQEHFNENYLESDIFPKSTFSGKVVKRNLQNTKVSGHLKIHGITNKINVGGTLLKEDNKIIISAEFTLKLDDYGVEIPTIVMYKIAEEVIVKVNIELLEMQ